MAAVSEDRTGAYEHERTGTSYRYLFDLPSSEVLYENTLAQLNSSDEIIAVDHSAGDDDSGVNIFAVLEHQDEDSDPLSTAIRRDRGGTSPQAHVYDGVVLALENDDADLTGYSIGGTAYAVDNATVASGSGDGSGGTYATAGTVIGTNSEDDRVFVHVDGLVN